MFQAPREQRDLWGLTASALIVIVLSLWSGSGLGLTAKSTIPFSNFARTQDLGGRQGFGVSTIPTSWDATVQVTNGTLLLDPRDGTLWALYQRSGNWMVQTFSPPYTSANPPASFLATAETIAFVLSMNSSNASQPSVLIYGPQTSAIMQGAAGGSATAFLNAASGKAFLPALALSDDGARVATIWATTIANPQAIEVVVWDVATKAQLQAFDVTAIGGCSQLVFSKSAALLLYCVTNQTSQSMTMITVLSSRYPSRPGLSIPQFMPHWTVSAVVDTLTSPNSFWRGASSLDVVAGFSIDATGTGFQVTAGAVALPTPGVPSYAQVSNFPLSQAVKNPTRPVIHPLSGEWFGFSVDPSTLIPSVVRGCCVMSLPPLPLLYLQAVVDTGVVTPDSFSPYITSIPTNVINPPLIATPRYSLNGASAVLVFKSGALTISVVAYDPETFAQLGGSVITGCLVTSGTPSAAWVSPIGFTLLAQTGSFCSFDLGSGGSLLSVVSGVVTSLAGGLLLGWADGSGSSAKMSKITSIASTDGPGRSSVYFTDTNNNCFRKLTFATAAVTSPMLCSTVAPSVTQDGQISLTTMIAPVSITPSLSFGVHYIVQQNGALRRFTTLTSTVTTLPTSVVGKAQVLSLGFVPYDYTVLYLVLDVGVVVAVNTSVFDVTGPTFFQNVSFVAGVWNVSASATPQVPAWNSSSAFELPMKSTSFALRNTGTLMLTDSSTSGYRTVCCVQSAPPFVVDHRLLSSRLNLTFEVRGGNTDPAWVDVPTPTNYSAVAVSVFTQSLWTLSGKYLLYFPIPLTSTSTWAFTFSKGLYDSIIAVDDPSGVALFLASSSSHLVGRAAVISSSASPTVPQMIQFGVPNEVGTDSNHWNTPRGLLGNRTHCLVADSYNHQLRLLQLPSGIPDPSAGGGSGDFLYTNGVITAVVGQQQAAAVVFLAGSAAAAFLPFPVALAAYPPIAADSPIITSNVNIYIGSGCTYCPQMIYIFDGTYLRAVPGTGTTALNPISNLLVNPFQFQPPVSYRDQQLFIGESCSILVLSANKWDSTETLIGRRYSCSASTSSTTATGFAGLSKAIFQPLSMTLDPNSGQLFFVSNASKSIGVICCFLPRLNTNIGKVPWYPSSVTTVTGFPFINSRVFDPIFQTFFVVAQNGSVVSVNANTSDAGFSPNGVITFTSPLIILRLALAPGNPLLYGVDPNGVVWSMDVRSGVVQTVTTTLPPVGTSATLLAVNGTTNLLALPVNWNCIKSVNLDTRLPTLIVSPCGGSSTNPLLSNTVDFTVLSGNSSSNILVITDWGQSLLLVTTQGTVRRILSVPSASRNFSSIAAHQFISDAAFIVDNLNNLVLVFRLSLRTLTVIYGEPGLLTPLVIESVLSTSQYQGALYLVTRSGTSFYRMDGAPYLNYEPPKIPMSSGNILPTTATALSLTRLPTIDIFGSLVAFGALSTSTILIFSSQLSGFAVPVPSATTLASLTSFPAVSAYTIQIRFDFLAFGRSTSKMILVRSTPVLMVEYDLTSPETASSFKTIYADVGNVIRLSQPTLNYTGVLYDATPHPVVASALIAIPAPADYIVLLLPYQADANSMNTTVGRKGVRGILDGASNLATFDGPVSVSWSAATPTIYYVADSSAGARKINLLNVASANPFLVSSVYNTRFLTHLGNVQQNVAVGASDNLLVTTLGDDLGVYNIVSDSLNGTSMRIEIPYQAGFSPISPGGLLPSPWMGGYLSRWNSSVVAFGAFSTLQGQAAFPETATTFVCPTAIDSSLFTIEGGQPSRIVDEVVASFLNVSQYFAYSEKQRWLVRLCWGGPTSCGPNQQLASFPLPAPVAGLAVCKVTPREIFLMSDGISDVRLYDSVTFYNISIIGGQGQPTRIVCMDPSNAKVTDDSNCTIIIKGNYRLFNWRAFVDVTPTQLFAAQRSPNFVGSGIQGMLDGEASSAQFLSPLALTFLSNTTTMYVSDAEGSVIRRVDAFTFVTTVVRGLFGVRALFSIGSANGLRDSDLIIFEATRMLQLNVSTLALSWWFGTPQRGSSNVLTATLYTLRLDNISGAAPIYGGQNGNGAIVFFSNARNFLIDGFRFPVVTARITPTSAPPVSTSSPTTSSPSTTPAPSSTAVTSSTAPTTTTGIPASGSLSTLAPPVPSTSLPTTSPSTQSSTAPDTVSSSAPGATTATSSTASPITSTIALPPSPDCGLISLSALALTPILMKVRLAVLAPMNLTLNIDGTRSAAAWQPFSPITVRIAQGPATIQEVRRLSDRLVWVSLQVDQSLPITNDVVIQLSVSRSSFDICAPQTDLGLSLKLEATPLPIPAEVQRSSAVAATVASGVAGFSGSSALALQTSRAIMALELSKCEFSDYEPVDFMNSPTQLAVGVSKGAYFRGALVGNAAILVGFAVLATVLLLIVHIVCKDDTYLRSAHRVHFPGCLIFPYAVVMPGFTAASMALTIHGNGASDQAIGISVLLVTLLSIGVIAVPLLKYFDSTFITEPRMLEAQKDLGIVVSGPERILLGVAHWRDNGRGFKYHFGVLFGDYRKTFYWYLLIELAFGYLGGLLDGYRPNTAASCQVALGMATTLGLVTFVVALIARPCIGWFNGGHQILQALLVTLSSGLLFISTFTENNSDGSDPLSEAGAVIALSVIGLAVLKAVADVILAIYKRVQLNKFESLAEKRLAEKKGDEEMTTLEAPLISTHREGAILLGREIDGIEIPGFSQVSSSSAEVVVPPSHARVAEPTLDDILLGIGPTEVGDQADESDPFLFPKVKPTKGPATYKSAESQQLYNEIRAGLALGIESKDKKKQTGKNQQKKKDDGIKTGAKFFGFGLEDLEDILGDERPDEVNEEVCELKEVEDDGLEFPLPPPLPAAEVLREDHGSAFDIL